MLAVMAKVSDTEIVEAVLSSPSIAAAARSLGVCREAVHKRLRKADMRATISQVERAHFVAIRAQVAAGFLDAVAVTRSLLAAEDPQVRLAVAGRMFAAAKVAGVDVATRADRDRGLRQAVRAERTAGLLREQRGSPDCPTLSDLDEDDFDDIGDAADELVRSGTPRDLEALPIERFRWKAPPEPR